LSSLIFISFNSAWFNVSFSSSLFTPIKGRIDSLPVYIYKAETCTNILRYNTCMSSYPGDHSQKWWVLCSFAYLRCFHPLPVPMAARITKYINKYVRSGLCLIYMFSFYFWSPSLARKMRKTNMRYYPKYPSRSWHPIYDEYLWGKYPQFLDMPEEDENWAIMVVQPAILTYTTMV
jgi:hypothetical protein